MERAERGGARWKATLEKEGREEGRRPRKGRRRRQEGKRRQGRKGIGRRVELDSDSASPAIGAEKEGAARLRKEGRGKAAAREEERAAALRRKGRREQGRKGGT